MAEGDKCVSNPQSNAAQPQATGQNPPLPSDAVILLTVRGTALFPGLVLPLAVGRPKSIAAVQQAVREERQIGVLLQRNGEINDPGPDDLYRIGTLANILRYVTTPDGTHHIVVQGVQRIRILDFYPGTLFPAARAVHISEPDTRSPEIEARFLNLQNQAIGLRSSSLRHRRDSSRPCSRPRRPGAGGSGCGHDGHPGSGQAGDSRASRVIPKSRRLSSA